MVKTVDYYKNECTKLKNELAVALNSGTQAEITRCRGRLIRLIKTMLFKCKDDLTDVPSAYISDKSEEYKKDNPEILCDDTYEYYSYLLNKLMEDHVNQIEERINENKNSENKRYSIPKEIILKIRRTATTINIHKRESEYRESKLVRSCFSSIWSVSKFVVAPALIVTNIGISSAAGLVGVAVGFSCDVVKNVFGHVCNSQKGVKFNITKKFGGFLFKKTNDFLGKINSSIIRK